MNQQGRDRGHAQEKYLCQHHRLPEDREEDPQDDIIQIADMISVFESDFVAYRKSKAYLINEKIDSA